MKKVSFRNLPAYRFQIFDPFAGEIQHAVLTRQGGTSKPPFNSLNVRFSIGDDPKNVIANRKLICGAMEIQPQNLISADQTHSKNVWIVDQDFLASTQGKNDGTLSDTMNNVDAFVTNIPGTTLMIQVADCQALLFFDPVKKVIAAVHAGWKGLVQDITGETIKIMQEKFSVDTATLKVGVAPSLGPCCSQFSDPENEIPVQYHQYITENKAIGVRFANTADNSHTRSGSCVVDLWQLSLDQLQKHGVLPDNIEFTKRCTSCEGEDEFFSFRREKGTTGRFGALIKLI